MIKDIKYKLDSEIRERPSGQPQAAVLIGLLNYNHAESASSIVMFASKHKFKKFTVIIAVSPQIF